MAHLLSVSLGAVVVIAHLGAAVWVTMRRRVREEVVRLRVARAGEDLLAALAPLPVRCEALQASAEQVVRCYHLSAADQQRLVGVFGDYPGRIQDIERQVRQALHNLVSLRGRDLDERSDRLGTLDAEICFLVAEISDREGLWSAELAGASLPQVA